MIKTHKPRGHIWTCPSLFQQSTEIRNLSFGDFKLPAARVIAPDSDDELQPKQRAAKRRKIETLADEFLNSQPLIITCVRPHPSKLTGALEANERARTSAKYVLPASELPDDDDDELWADVDGVYEMTKNASKAWHPSIKAFPGESRPQRKTGVTSTETVTEDQASLACKQVRRVKAVKISLDPSTEAVGQAAVLRARGLQRAATKRLRLREEDSSDVINESDNAKPRRDSGCASLLSRSVHDRKSRGTEWLLRRHTTLYELHADESQDELNRSKTETPSRPSQITVQAYSPEPQNPARSTSPDSSAEDQSSVIDQSDILVRPRERVSLGTYAENWGCFAGTNRSEDVLEEQASLAKVSYHTAPEVTDTKAATLTVENASQDEDDSQAQLLRRQGIDVAPRRLSTSTNGKAPATFIMNHNQDRPLDAAASSSVDASQESVREFKKPAVKSKASKRVKSVGHVSTHEDELPRKSRSVPKETLEVGKIVAPPDHPRYPGATKDYTVAPTKDTDSTPFMFRKRTTRAAATTIHTDTVTTRSRGERRLMNFPSSEGGPVVESGGTQVSAQPALAEAPILDVSFGNDSFAPKLTLALTDEHMNAVLPSETKSAGRLSSVKRAITRELENEGVEILCMDGEPASSQVEGSAEARALTFSAVSMAAEAHGSGEEADKGTQHHPPSEVARTQWPGTQALLRQAHHDFFRSPEKPHACDTTQPPGSQEADAELASHNTHREALGTLSQEAAPPLPSTQAMVEAWSPWSTIKNPEGITTRVAGPSPSLVHGRKTRHSTMNADQRRSSLRFSTSSTNSPRTGLTFAVTKTASQEQRDKLSASFPPFKEGSTTACTPFSVKETGSQDHTQLVSSTDCITTSNPTSHGSQQNMEEANTALAWDPSTVAQMSASDPPIENDKGSLASSIQYAQRPLSRDDSDVEEAIIEFESTVLSLSGFDGF